MNIDQKTRATLNSEENVTIITNELKECLDKFAPMRVMQNQKNYSCKLCEETKYKIRERNALRI